jgi:transposase InsO family protein
VTEHDVLVGFRLRLFTLAEESGNVAAACRAMGVHRSTYYRLKRKVDRWGLEALRVRERRRPQAGWKLREVTTDNGSEFRSRAFGEAVEQLGARQRFIKAGRPNSNGCVERLQLTILEECWRPAFARSLVPKITALQRDLDEYLATYNFRAHTGRITKGRIPGEIVYGARKTRPVR